MIENVSPAIQKKPVIPIMSMIHLSSEVLNEKEIVIMRGSDTESTIIRKEVANSIELDNTVREVCFEYESMLGILKTLPEQPIMITIDDNLKMQIKTDNGVYDILTNDAENYPLSPELEEPEEFKVDGSIIKDIIEASAFSVSDTARPLLSGVNIAMKDDKICVAATDAIKLVAFRTKYDSLPAFNFTISNSAIKTIKVIADADEVKVQTSRRFVSFAKGKVKIILRLVEGTYPNYNAVIPTGEAPVVVTMPSKEFLNAIDRIYIASRSANYISLVIEGMLMSLTSVNKDYNISARESITGMVEKCNDDGFTIGMKADFLTACIKACKAEEIQLNFRSKSTAIIISSTEENDNTVSATPIL